MSIKGWLRPEKRFERWQKKEAKKLQELKETRIRETGKARLKALEIKEREQIKHARELQKKAKELRPHHLRKIGRAIERGAIAGAKEARKHVHIELGVGAPRKRRKRPKRRARPRTWYYPAPYYYPAPVAYPARPKPKRRRKKKHHKASEKSKRIY